MSVLSLPLHTYVGPCNLLGHGQLALYSARSHDPATDGPLVLYSGAAERSFPHDEELWEAGWSVEHLRYGTPTGHWRLAEGYKLSEQRGVVTSCDPLYRANCSGGSIALPPNCEFVAVKIRGELRIGLKLTAAVNVGDQLLLPNYLLRN